jgi:hypothetical protein
LEPYQQRTANAVLEEEEEEREGNSPPEPTGKEYNMLPH